MAGAGLAGAGIAAGIAAGVGAARRRNGGVFRRVEVRGESMLPLLEPGDRLVLLPLATVRPGMIVALPQPGDPGRVLVKRVATVDGDRVTVVGDNPSASTDSRTFGPVPAGELLGRAVYRYAPLPRAGRLR